MIEKLPKQIWSRLDWSEFGGEPPEDGEIFGYIEQGEIKGWYLVENVKHVGPFFVVRECRGNGIGNELAQHASETLEGEYYVAALNEQTRQMCETFGMTEVNGTLYVKE